MVDQLNHYGVPGMKWGVRKEKKRVVSSKTPKELIYSKTLKNGGKLKVYKKSYEEESLFLRSLVSKEEYSDLHSFTLTDKYDRKVGDASFIKPKDKNVLELEWIGIKRKDRRNGYARAALTGVIKYASDNGIEELNLTATKMGAPLYESLGFVATKNRRGKDTSNYVLKVKSSISHNSKTLIDYVIEALNNTNDLDGLDETLPEFKTEQLQHYGVPGMKWGVRKDRYRSLSRDERKSTRKDFKKKYNAEVEGARRRSASNDKRVQRTARNLKAAQLTVTGLDKATREYMQAKNQQKLDRKTAGSIRFGRDAIFDWFTASEGGASRREVARDLHENRRLRQK